MRAIMSPSGSINAIVRALLLPARLDQPRDHPLGAEVAERDARELVLAVEAARPPAQFAAVADAGGRWIARQLGELEGRCEPVFHGRGLVARDRLEPRALGRVLLRQSAPQLVLLDRTRL